MSATIDCLDGRPWAVLPGDCAASLARLPADSVDACVTDTPYGLSTLLDPPNLDREALWRKLTEGTREAPIRTLLRAWLDTGDNPKMTGRGFMGKEWDALVPPPNTWRAVWRVLKPGAYCFAFGGTRTVDLISLSLRLADFEVDDMVMWLYGQGFPKRVRIDLKIDQHFGKAGERPVTGKSARHGGGTGNGAAWNIPADVPNTTGPATLDAARFVGWDRALRPGWEPIIVAVKPLRGTVAENALAYGTGGLHVDACRLPRGDADAQRERHGKASIGYGGSATGFTSSGGGYPANVAMDEEVAERLDGQVGYLHGAGNKTPVTFQNGNRIYGQYAPKEVHQLDRGGMPSRFFYTAKASSSERDAGLEDLPPLTAGERCDREDGTAGVNGYAGTRGEGGRNPHPTVKPVALMRYLVRLAAPPGAHDPDESKRPVILDPFAGSGSTGVACMQEGLRFVGCEMDPEMVDVMRRRLQHAHALDPDDAEAPVRRADAPGQRVLF